MDVAIIGGGAAGFFAAISVKDHHPESTVIIYEKSQQLLGKVKISGGGRCNVTNSCTSLDELAAAYPRGGRFLKKAFQTFSTQHTMAWFESRGVPLLVQADTCVFPESQYSQDIIDCFLDQAEDLGIEIKRGMGIESIKQNNQKLELIFQKTDQNVRVYDKVIVATGGSPRREGLEWLENLQHKIVDPVPSLFTFNLPTESITGLTGVAVERTIVSIQGSKLKSEGPLLITHWGFSGPAILKLSAFAARVLYEMAYEFKIQVNWVNEPNHEIVLAELNRIQMEHGQKLLTNLKPFALPDRLWRYLLYKAGFSLPKKWGELGKKGLNKLVNSLINDVYSASGKTGFKEEFVTCGGVSLESIDSKTMGSKVCKNLYFAGEIMDIDGITGGFNFQAAWTTAFIAGKLQAS